MSNNSGNVSGWLGWVGFAGIMLALGGVFSLLTGFVALFEDAVIYNSASNALWVLDFTQWGWIHITIGILALAATASLFSGRMFGRLFAAFIAFLSAIANMAFLPVYPFWALIIITVDIMVIYAVIAHGDELKEVQ